MPPTIDAQKIDSGGVVYLPWKMWWTPRSIQNNPRAVNPFPQFHMKIFCLSLLLLLFPACVAPWTKAVDTAMRDEMKQQELVGLAVGVVKDGRIEYLKGYGWADREKQTPVTRQTMFRWASISKSLTAVAALQLWERDRLELGRDVRDYVPEFPEHNATIRIRHLLSHQGGIVHYTNGPVIATPRFRQRCAALNSATACCFQWRTRALAMAFSVPSTADTGAECEYASDMSVFILRSRSQLF